MSLNTELRAEELEALEAIYDGDEALTIDTSCPTCPVVRYKIGEDGSKHSFVVALKLLEEYPMDSGPELDLTAFYNNLSQGQRGRIENIANEEMEAGIGAAVCFSVIEKLKENVDLIFAHHDDDDHQENDHSNTLLTIDDNTGKDVGTVDTAAPKLSEESRNSSMGALPSNANLTKAQKRRLWDKGGLITSERPRGWDWVDVVRHLSQTGAKDN